MRETGMQRSGRAATVSVGILGLGSVARTVVALGGRREPSCSRSTWSRSFAPKRRHRVKVFVSELVDLASQRIEQRER